MIEIWKDILGYEGSYQASSFGEIKSLCYNGKITPSIIQKILYLSSNNIPVKEISEKLKIHIVTIYKIRSHPNNYLHKDKILKPMKDTGGYLQVCLYKSSIRSYKLIHHLILETFVGQKPFPKAVCRHLDGNKLNNTILNLEWGTYSENIQDSIFHKTFKKAIKKQIKQKKHYRN